MRRRAIAEILTTEYSGTVYNIRDVTIDPDRQWVDVLAQSGVA